MTGHNPPPWAGSKVTPLEAFNRALGQALVDAGNALVIELFGTQAQKAKVRAWKDRNRSRVVAEPLASWSSPVEAYIAQMRAIGTVERAAAKAQLTRHVDGLYADLGMERVR